MSAAGPNRPGEDGPRPVVGGPEETSGLTPATGLPSAGAPKSVPTRDPGSTGKGAKGKPFPRRRSITSTTEAWPGQQQDPAVAAARRRRRPSLRGEVPTDTIPLVGSLRGTPYRDPRVTRAVAEERAAAEVLDLCLRVSEVMLQCGASAYSVESAAVAVGVASGLDDMDVDLTMQSMHIQCRTSGGATVARLRVVRRPRQDFARLSAVHALVDDLVSGEIDTEQASSRLREITRTPRTWSRWVVALAQGLVGAGVALALGASWLAVVVALLSALAVDWAKRRAEPFHLPDLYLGAIGGLVATLVAFAAYAAGSTDWVPISGSDFAFIMAGGIVALLPSRTITSAMEDVLSGYPVTGTARLFEVLLHTFGLIVGVAMGLSVCIQAVAALSIDLTPPPFAKLGWASAEPATVLIGAFLVGVGASITVQNRHRMALPTGFITVLVVYLASLASETIGVGRITAVGLAAVVLGFLTRVVALRLDAPSLTLAVPASYGLMPGLSIFVGLYQLISDGEAQDTAAGWASVLTAFGIIFAIATGSTLGDLLAAPLDEPVAERRRQGRRPSAGDTLTPPAGFVRPGTLDAGGHDGPEPASKGDAGGSPPRS